MKSLFTIVLFASFLLKGQSLLAQDYLSLNMGSLLHRYHIDNKTTEVGFGSAFSISYTHRFSKYKLFLNSEVGYVNLSSKYHSFGDEIIDGEVVLSPNTHKFRYEGSRMIIGAGKLFDLGKFSTGFSLNVQILRLIARDYLSKLYQGSHPKQYQLSPSTRLFLNYNMGKRYVVGFSFDYYMLTSDSSLSEKPESLFIDFSLRNIALAQIQFGIRI